MIQKLEGIIVPIITALTAEGRFDEFSQKKLIEYLVANEVYRIFGLGLTGEKNLLPHSMKPDVMDTIVKTVQDLRYHGKNLEVVIGVDGKDLQETKENIAHASKLDINAIVLQPSSIDGIDYNSLINFALENSTHPIYLYANPDTAKQNNEVITPEVIKNISNYERILGIKVSDIFAQLVKYCKALEGKNTSLYMGNAMDLSKAFSESSSIKNKPDGVITGPGNLFPKEWVMAWLLRDDLKIPATQELYWKLTQFDQLWNDMKTPNVIAALKYLLHKNEILDSPYCLCGTVSKEDQEKLLKGYDVIKSISIKN